MVKIRRHMAPLTRTSGRGNTAKYITIHETANRGRGANANAHARLQAGTNSRMASWHYTVDSTEIVQSFDDNVKCWHAGGTANSQSIAIEICVNSDSNYNTAFRKAAELVAYLRKKHGIPWNRIVSHKFWTGKNCPTIMLGNNRWDEFVNLTGATSTSTSTASTASPSSKPSKPKGQITVSEANRIIDHINDRTTITLDESTQESLATSIDTWSLGQLVELIGRRVGRIDGRVNDINNQMTITLNESQQKALATGIETWTLSDLAARLTHRIGYTFQRTANLTGEIEGLKELVTQLATGQGVAIDYDRVQEAARAGAAQALEEAGDDN